MKQYIVTFRERVKNDYNSFFREHENHSIRYNSYEEARDAAKEYCKYIPELPYRRQATVFNGPVITCQWISFFETKILKYTTEQPREIKAPFKFANLFNMIF